MTLTYNLLILLNNYTNYITKNTLNTLQLSIPLTPQTNNYQQNLCPNKRGKYDKVKSWTKSEALKMKDKSAVLEEEISSLLLSSQSAILNKE